VIVREDVFSPARHAAAYWRAGEGGHARRGPHRQHVVAVRVVRQRRADNYSGGAGIAAFTIISSIELALRRLRERDRAGRATA
jgi:hypothetical protein